ncbi:hypothetical protein [Thiocapsa sp.]|uniref:hypothetical protein n=1 Tax=Thiocapsa sp. TaxID=2024551 RepID=UPI002BBAACF5|nr:hypothetical protein [Thiocapsa sp.]HSO82197.1 hypothetical protein [Thiocapsa sp.]
MWRAAGKARPGTAGRDKAAKQEKNIMNGTTAIVAVIPAAGALQGCATITRGSTQEIAVDSTPQGAQVQTTGGASYTTPAAVKLKRNISHKLDFTAPGYKPASAVVTPSISGGGAAGMAGNILLGGIIGGAIDAGSGAMYDLAPTRVHVVMTKMEE